MWGLVLEAAFASAASCTVEVGSCSIIYYESVGINSSIMHRKKSY